MDAHQMRSRIESIRDLPTLPTVAFEVNRLLEDVNTRIQDVTVAIERDQALTVKILKLVNSAFFGLRGRVGNISRAVIVLGFNTVRSAVLSVAVIEAFGKRRHPLQGFDIRRFWLHAIAVAVTSRHLAERLRSVAPEDAFTAGLLHDVGKLILYQFFPELFAQIWNEAAGQGLTFSDAETRFSPLGHAGIGRILARRWQLPEELVRAVGAHHAVAASQDLPLWLVVHAANAAVHAAEDGRVGAVLSERYVQAPEALQDQLVSLERWFPALRPQITEAECFFLEENGQ